MSEKRISASSAVAGRCEFGSTLQLFGKTFSTEAHVDFAINPEKSAEYSVLSTRKVPAMPRMLGTRDRSGDPLAEMFRN
jgi:hypothetical protein